MKVEMPDNPRAAELLGKTDEELSAARKHAADQGKELMLTWNLDLRGMGDAVARLEILLSIDAPMLVDEQFVEDFRNTMKLASGMELLRRKLAAACPST